MSRIDREILLNATLVLLSITVTFGALEGALRVGLVPSDEEISADVDYCEPPRRLHSFHQTYGWTLVPNATYVRHWKYPEQPDERNVFLANQRGFRDTYNSGERNVIVVGDSFTEGGGVSQNATYTYLLDRWTPKTSFRTYGVGGYGTDQELLIYRNVSSQYDHDAVVVGYYMGNDVKNNAGKGWPPGPRRPRFAIQNGTVVQTHEPVDHVPDTAAGFKDYGTVGEIHNTFRETSYAYEWTYVRFRVVLEKANVLKAGSSNKYRPPTGEKLDRQLQLTEALLDEVATEAASNNATVFLVVIPARGDVRPSNPAHYPREVGKPYYDAQRQMLRHVAQNNSNVELVRLKPRLKREVARGREVYGQGQANAHFNNRGYRLTARVIYDELVASGVIEPRSDVNFSRDYTRDTRTCRALSTSG